MEKNFPKKFGPSSSGSEELRHRIEKICDGLVYISEVDSPVTIFAGTSAGEGEKSGILNQLEMESGESVREIDFRSFFDRLTVPKDWHGERESVRTKKFLDLRKLIEENVTEPRVFKIGDTHVRIVAAGLGADGRVLGITMQALET